jgi:uncharacterized protein (TIGR02246 family)
MEELTDIEQIMQLTARYNHAYDERDAEGWADCWTQDGHFTRANGEQVEGRPALVELCRNAAVKGRHVTSDHVIEVDGDTARQTCYLQYMDRDNDFALLMFATYHDELVRQDGRWRFAARRAAKDAG